MLHTLRGGGFHCSLTLFVSYLMHPGAGVIRVNPRTTRINVSYKALHITIGWSDLALFAIKTYTIMCYRSGIFLGVQFPKIGNFSRARGKVFILKLSYGPYKLIPLIQYLSITAKSNHQDENLKLNFVCPQNRQNRFRYVQ